MPLHLYRRHLSGTRCIGGHAPESQTYEGDEMRPRWKKCGCPIYASGKLATGFVRRATHRVTWDDGRVVISAWERGAEPPVVVPPPAAGPERITLAEVEQKYLANRAARNLAPASYGKYQTLMTQLRSFTAKRGYAMLDQIGADDMDAFYASWKDGKTSKGKKLERLKGFWNFCVKRKWIKDSPVEDLEPPPGYSIPKQKSPFTNEELGRIFGAAAEWQDLPWHNGPASGVVTKNHVVTFCMLLTETGLRIGDAALFDFEQRVNKETHECFLRMHKTGKMLYTWLNDDLFNRLQGLAEAFGPRPFVAQSTEKGRAADVWRERLWKVFEAAGPFGEHNPTPHRFRHTFIRLLLERGVPVEDVAELAGDTPEVVRRYYALWVPARQARLTDILRRTFAENKKSTWRPRVVPMRRLAAK